jgi:hypothetical protein
VGNGETEVYAGVQAWAGFAGPRTSQLRDLVNKFADDPHPWSTA